MRLCIVTSKLLTCQAAARAQQSVQAAAAPGPGPSRLSCGAAHPHHPCRLPASPSAWPAPDLQECASTACSARRLRVLAESPIKSKICSLHRGLHCLQRVSILSIKDYRGSHSSAARHQIFPATLELRASPCHTHPTPYTL